MPAYPSSIASFTTRVDDQDVIIASHVNALQNEMEAVQVELGLTPSGSHSTVADYLDALNTAIDDVSESDIAHNDLIERNASGAHQMSAITGLGTTLNAKLSKSGGEMTGDLAIHTYVERAAIRNDADPDPLTIDFANDPQLLRNSRGIPVIVEYTNIPSSTDEVRSLTLVFQGPPSDVSWPTNTRFPGGEEPTLEGETWLSLVARGGEVTVFTVATEVA